MAAPFQRGDAAHLATPVERAWFIMRIRNTDLFMDIDPFRGREIAHGAQ